MWVRFAASFLEAGDNAVEVVVDCESLGFELLVDPGVVHHRVGVGKGENSESFFSEKGESVESL